VYSNFCGGAATFGKKSTRIRGEGWGEKKKEEGRDKRENPPASEKGSRSTIARSNLGRKKTQPSKHRGSGSTKGLQRDKAQMRK